jgi:hypothetical protein
MNIVGQSLIKIELLEKIFLVGSYLYFERDNEKLKLMLFFVDHFQQLVDTIKNK